jgi:hypothetical protein
MGIRRFEMVWRVVVLDRVGREASRDCRGRIWIV